MSAAIPPPYFLSNTRPLRCAKCVPNPTVIDNDPTIQASAAKGVVSQGVPLQASNLKVGDIDEHYVGYTEGEEAVNYNNDRDHR